MTVRDAADPDAIQRTRDSLGRCVACETFLDRFYQLFMGSSPKIAKMFENTDFERQKRVLQDSLYVLLVAAGTSKGPAHDELARLARLHEEIGVGDDMYTFWLDSLVQAAREHDTRFTDELEQDWRATLAGPIEQLKTLG